MCSRFLTLITTFENCCLLLSHGSIRRLVLWGRLYTQNNYLAAISECFYLDSRCSIPPSIDEHISNIQKISSTRAIPHQPPPLPSTYHGNKLLRDPPNLRDDERAGMSLRTRDKPSERGRLPNTSNTFNVVGVIAWLPSPFTPGRVQAAATARVVIGHHPPPHPFPLRHHPPRHTHPRHRPLQQQQLFLPQLHFAGSFSPPPL
ncbi:hypothetical protein QTP88_017809 [Uroleucon formosanum]